MGKQKTVAVHHNEFGSFMFNVAKIIS